MPNASRHESPGALCGMPRREFLRLGALGAAGLAMGDWLKLATFAQPAGAADKATAKAVIQLWMGGGPPHTDTFDPKPGAGDDYTGPYKRAIPTNVPGIQLCQTLPLLAQQADKFAILRGMTHFTRAHETASYIMLTGTLPSGELVYPSMGAVVALKKAYEGGYQGALPPYIAITRPPGRFNSAGFLDARCSPFATGGNPGARDFRVDGIVPASGMTTERLKERRALLESLDALAGRAELDAALREMDANQRKAYDLILGEAKEAFDLSAESDDLRDRYGRTTFGQSCLLARRLVAAGVPFVTVNWGGWDTHKQHFERMDKMLPDLDKGFSALLEDLHQRGLLETTIVVWGGEFGRTPKISKEPPWNGGRQHFCDAFSVVVAGGGFKGGQVVGVTDRLGEKVVKRPVYPWDLSGSIYKLLGIDPKGRLPHPHGCVAYVTPPVGGNVATGGLLTEIM